MDYLGVMAGSKWDLLAKLSVSSQSPTNLAKEIQTSVPNVLHHLKLLEAYGLVKSSTLRSSGAGKPPSIYGLATPFIHVSFLDEITQVNKRISPNPLDAYMLRCLIDSPTGWQTPLIKLALEHDGMIEKDTAVAIQNIKGNHCDIVFIGKDISDYRGTKSKITIEFNGKFEFAIWSHTPEELRMGVENKEKYFMELIKARVIHDPTELLKVYK